jgi:hypothetical protein
VLKTEAERREFLAIARPCLEAFEYTVNDTTTRVDPRNRARQLPQILHASALAHRQEVDMMVRSIVPKGCLRADKRSLQKRLGVGCVGAGVLPRKRKKVKAAVKSEYRPAAAQPKLGEVDEWLKRKATARG